jgi:hypothetical protein
MYFGRFLLPILPALLILGAEFSCTIIDKISIDKINHNFSLLNSSGRLKQLFVALVVILLTLHSALLSLRHDFLLLQEDTRTLAKIWIETALDEGSRIAVDWPHHGPPLATQEQPEPASSKLYDLVVVGGHGLSEHTLDEYRAQGIGYLIASSNIQDFPLLDATANAEKQRFYESIARELREIEVFAPFSQGAHPEFNVDELYGPATDLWRRERPGPVVTIYQILLTENSVGEGLERTTSTAGLR